MSDLLSLLDEFKQKPLQKRHYMVLDVETRRSAKDVGGWHKAAEMGVSIAVLYDSSNDSFTPYSQAELDGMFSRLLKAELIVGFNISGFDYTVLQPFANYDLKKLPTLDMLIKVKSRLGHRVSLDNLAQATFGIGKNADGMQALLWWKQGRLADITKYCIQDVDITKKVYEYGLEHGHLFYSNKSGKKQQVSVNF